MKGDGLAAKTCWVRVASTKKTYYKRVTAMLSLIQSVVLTTLHQVWLANLEAMGSKLYKEEPRELAVYGVDGATIHAVHEACTRRALQPPTIRRA